MYDQLFRSQSIIMKIYTRTGDDGTTALGFGVRIQKCDGYIKSLGEMDELNSHVGLVLSLVDKTSKVQDEECYRFLVKLQSIIFDLGTSIAYPRKSGGDDFIVFLSKETLYMENEIDRMTSQLPPLTAFIMPGGDRIGATVHIARSVCRRVERSLVSLECKTDVLNAVIRFVNRLSDYLFTVARFYHYKYSNGHEVTYTNWQKRN